MIYAIETTGFGKRTRYAIKAVDERGTIPVNYVTYRTEADARAAAELLGLQITAVGDIWQLLHAVRKAVQP